MSGTVTDTTTADTRRAAANGNAIELDQLTKRFGEYVAVDNLSLTVPAGSVFGFLGPNGAGKTTTIGMMLGLIPASDGTARVFGHDVRTELPEVLKRTGAMVERPAFYPFLSGRMNVSVFARQVGINDSERVEEVLRTVNMIERADAKFGGYSTGMKQRIGIATALLADPDLVVLDEPTSGLDPAGQREIRSLVQQLSQTGHTIFISSHILAEIQEICSHVAIINRGRLVSAGRMDEILSGTEELLIDVDRPDDARKMLIDLIVVEDVEALDGQVRVNAPFESAADINRALVQAGIRVSQLRQREGQLEERFLALTGEDGSEENGG